MVELESSNKNRVFFQVGIILTNVLKMVSWPPRAQSTTPMNLPLWGQPEITELRMHLPGILLSHRNSEGYPHSHGTRFRNRSHFSWVPVQTPIWSLQLGLGAFAHCITPSRSKWVPCFFHHVEVLFSYLVWVRVTRLLPRLPSTSEYLLIIMDILRMRRIASWLVPTYWGDDFWSEYIKRIITCE